MRTLVYLSLVTSILALGVLSLSQAQGVVRSLRWAFSHESAAQPSDAKFDRVQDQGRSGGDAKEVNEKPKAAEKVPGKVIPGDRIYFSTRAIDPSGYAKGKPAEILAELDRLVTTTFPKTYPAGKAHLHPWRQKWDEFLGHLDAHRQVTALILQSRSFLDTVTNTKSLCSAAVEGNLVSTEATWILVYLGFEYGHRPIQLKSVRIDECKVLVSYSYTRRDDPKLKELSFNGSSNIGRMGNDAVILIDCGKLQPGHYEIHLRNEFSETTELVRRFSITR